MTHKEFTKLHPAAPSVSGDVSEQHIQPKEQRTVSAGRRIRVFCTLTYRRDDILLCIFLQQNSNMAPTTRSKASSTGDVPVPAMAPPPLPTKVAGGKTKKAKPGKRPAATATKPVAAPSKVQKKKKSSPKKKSKGKGKKSSAETSVRSSSKASSRSSSKKPSSKKTPRPATTVQADFPELAQVLPFVDQEDLQPAASPSSSSAAAAARRAWAMRGRGRTDHVLLPDHGVLFDQMAHHMVNPPPWDHTRPGTGRRNRSNSSSSGKIRGLFDNMPKGFELAETPSQSLQGPPSSNSSGSFHNHVESYEKSRRERRRRAREAVPQGETQSEPLVEVKNAHVFKRPTVADVRRERTMMHDELREWVGVLRRARDDFDAVIGEIENKMQIIRAVNRMQAPLRKAALGRGR